MEIIKNIVLTGFMMAGKSQIGAALAKMLGCGFFDTDEMIVEKEKMSVNEIFEKKGEGYFRTAETAAAKEAAKMRDAVISTGGGLVLKAENLEILRRNGVIVNLRITPEVIKERMEAERKTRPLIRELDFSGIVEKLKGREDRYADCDFSITVSNERSPEEHAELILKELKRNGAI